MALPRQKEQDEIVQLIGFTVGGRLFGADILTVREILRDHTVEPSSSGPSFFKGFALLRGERVPVVDAAVCVGHQRLSTPEKGWLLVAQTEDIPIGYQVDSVSRILKVDADTILPAPEIIAAGLRTPYISGVCETERGLLVVVNLDRMLLNDERKALRQIMNS